MRRARAAASATIAESDNPDARKHAVLELAATASETAIPALVRALDDDSQDVREKAALALGLLSTADVIEPLLKALVDGDAGIESLSIERPGLHDAFVAIAGAQAAAELDQPTASEVTK